MNKINFFTLLFDCLVGFFFSEEAGVDEEGVGFFFSSFLFFSLSFVHEVGGVVVTVVEVKQRGGGVQ